MNVLHNQAQSNPINMISVLPSYNASSSTCIKIIIVASFNFFFFIISTKKVLMIHGKVSQMFNIIVDANFAQFLLLNYFFHMVLHIFNPVH